MRNYQTTKKIMIIFCIMCIFIAIIIGFISADKLNHPTTVVDYMKSVIIPFFLFPLTIILILAYYDNILSGIVLLGYEIFIAIDYFNSSPYSNSLDHLKSGNFYLYVVIPTLIGIIYLYGFIKYKNKKNSRK